MILQTFIKAKKLIKKVKFDTETKTSYYFKVKEYYVKVDKIGENHNCTCEAGSLWRTGYKCSHIAACMYYLKKNPTKAYNTISPKGLCTSKNARVCLNPRYLCRQS